MFTPLKKVQRGYCIFGNNHNKFNEYTAEQILLLPTSISYNILFVTAMFLSVGKTRGQSNIW